MRLPAGAEAGSSSRGSRSLAVHELEFAASLTERPIKVALPGPYLLTRTMWMECISDRAYARRDELADDVVRVLREELHHLLAAGAALVQFDEPVLTEVVFSGQRPRQAQRSCAGRSARARRHRRDRARVRDRPAERRSSKADLPRDRTGAPRVPRELDARRRAPLLAGDYRAARARTSLDAVRVGTLFLEFSTPRAGEDRRARRVSDPSTSAIGTRRRQPEARRAGRETSTTIVARACCGPIAVFGHERLLLNSDCGFATFADNPGQRSSAIAEGKLAAMVRARASLGS